MKYLSFTTYYFIKSLTKILIICLCFCSVSKAENTKIWKIDDNLLTSKCFVSEEIFGNISGDELFNKYTDLATYKFIQLNHKNELWKFLDSKNKVNLYFLKNIGFYYNNGIALDADLQTAFGDNKLSFSNNLDSCVANKKSNEENLFSYEIIDSPGIVIDKCKLYAPFIKKKCIDIKIVKLNKISKSGDNYNEYINLYGIYELKNNKKIVLPLVMNFFIKEKKINKKIRSSNFDWLKNKKNIMYTKLFLLEDNFKQLLKKNISSKKNFYFGFENSEKSLYLNLLYAIEGQPTVIDFYDNRNYFTAGGQSHNYFGYGFIFIDFKKKDIIGLIHHNFYKTRSNFDSNPSIFIFSKNNKNIVDLPDQFFLSALKHLKFVNIINAKSKLRFMGYDNQVTELGSYYENQKLFFKNTRPQDLITPIDHKLLFDLSDAYIESKSLGFKGNIDDWIISDIFAKEYKIENNNIFPGVELIKRLSLRTNKMQKLIKELLSSEFNKKTANINL